MTTKSDDELKEEFIKACEDYAKYKARDKRNALIAVAIASVLLLVSLLLLSQ